MNELDLLRQTEFPTIMVPGFDTLEECCMGKTRLLMARDGLYIETAQPWGHLIKNVWVSPRPLPYGDVVEVDTFKDVFEKHLQPIIQGEMLADAAEYARDNKEWVGWIIYLDGEFKYFPIDFDATRVSADWRGKRPKGSNLVLDLHSHGRIEPFFSDDDDRDDAGGVKISMVLGNYRRSRGRSDFESAMRYVVEGFFINHEYEAAE